MKKQLSLQYRQFQHHNSDNIIANTTLLVGVSSTNSKEEIKKVFKLVSYGDSKYLTNKDIQDMVISDKPSEYIMKNYLGIPLQSKDGVLGVINDKEVKF